MFVRKGFSPMVGALMVMAFTSTASAETLRFGTIVPAKTHWGKVFNAWAKAVKKKSDGKLSVEWDFNGSAGGERVMISKIKSGQLDGAAVTSAGLGAIYKPFLAVQMPGICSSWKCLDKVRNGVMTELRQGANGAGFTFLGTGDVGKARTFSKGIEIRTPADMAKGKVFGSADDPSASTVASIIGYTPVLTAVTGLLPKLTSGQINVFTVPPLAVEQLQWAPHATHVVDSVAGFSVGGLVVKKSRVDGLPGDVADMFKKTGKKAGKMLTKKTRRRDNKSYKRLKKKLKVVKLTADEKSTWRAKFKAVRTKLGQGTYSADFVRKIERLAGK